MAFAVHIDINIDTVRLAAATEALHAAVPARAERNHDQVFPVSMIPKNGPWSADKIARTLKGLTVPASRSKTFRMMAADALRAGRKATPGGDSDAHFSLAASYKSLAHDDEWIYGERQRSHMRKSQSKKPNDG